jgi:hypothetical protein
LDWYISKNYLELFIYMQGLVCKILGPHGKKGHE